MFGLFASFTVCQAIALNDGLTKLPEEEVRKIASQIGTGKSAHEFCVAALASGRYEVVNICWEYPYTSNLLGEIMRKMPIDSNERDALIIMFFKNKNLTWLSYSDSAMLFGADSLAAKQCAEHVIPLLHKYLPGLPIDFREIDTQEKRLTLIGKFAKAAGLPFEESAEARRVWPPTRRTGVGGQQDGGDATKPGQPGSVATAAKAGEVGFLPGGWALWAEIASAIAAAGWLLHRSKRKNG